MKQASDLWIVIPVHNRKDFTLSCLASLRVQTCHDFSVVVIDDGSTDGTGEALANHYPDVHVLSGAGDLWWTRATNMGIQYAIERGASMILTLNDDLECTADYVSEMRQAAQSNPLCLLGSTSYDIDTGVLSYGGESIKWWCARFDRPGSRAGKLVTVTHLPGRGMLVPRSVIDAIGGFDEDALPHYGADYDLSMRARAAGFEAYCVTTARLFSRTRESGSVKIVHDRTLRNYHEHLFGIRGGGNLGVFWKLAWRHCPKHALLPCLIAGFSARLLGYPKHWALEAAKRISSQII